jgi:hypothetical protein
MNTIDAEKISAILTVNYDLYPIPGAAGNKWSDHTACFIFIGDSVKTEIAAHEKLREMGTDSSVKKINSWNLASSVNIFECN